MRRQQAERIAYNDDQWHEVLIELRLLGGGSKNFVHLKVDNFINTSQYVPIVLIDERRIFYQLLIGGVPFNDGLPSAGVEMDFDGSFRDMAISLQIITQHSRSTSMLSASIAPQIWLKMAGGGDISFQISLNLMFRPESVMKYS